MVYHGATVIEPNLLSRDLRLKQEKKADTGPNRALRAVVLCLDGAHANEDGSEAANREFGLYFKHSEICEYERTLPPSRKGSTKTEPVGDSSSVDGGMEFNQRGIRRMRREWSS